MSVPPEVLADRLNRRLHRHGAADILRGALDAPGIGPIALVSSFGAESVALLHLAAMVDRDLPVIFVETRMLFTETLVYQHELTERLRLRDVRIVGPAEADLARDDPGSALHRTDPDACCHLRKTAPLQKALNGFDGWITGRKRFHSDGRAQLKHFEVEASTGRIKINPLAHWSVGDVRDYIDENRLPRHPMVARGFPSIGCAPCTSRVAPGEDPRAGRWRGQQKDECGIHFVNGRMVKQGQTT